MYGVNVVEFALYTSVLLSHISKYGKYAEPKTTEYSMPKYDIIQETGTRDAKDLVL